VIYTSGTTGRPKGVMIEHKSIVSKNHFYRHKYSVGPRQASIFYRSYGFDGSIEEYLIPLLNGAKSIIYTSAVFDMSLFAKIVKTNGITKIDAPPQLLYQILQFDKDFLNSVNILISGGDKLNFSSFYGHDFRGKIYNSYGPTECTIDSHVFELTPAEKSLLKDRSVIGKNVFDCKSYILDANRNPVPIGVIGELYIGGAGLARGYLNRTDMTAERFVLNPFATELDIANGYTRLYKTGDLCRYMSDGNVEYVGRNDEQVKIRGYRIELSEVEYAMNQIKGIRQACVIAKDRKTDAGEVKNLVGYYVLESDVDPLTQAFITDKLSKVLPDYMVPAPLVLMENLIDVPCPMQTLVSLLMGT
jgi:amino acid adenylation domain-containing protein